MSVWASISTGAGIGLLIAFFGNLYVLPAVLKMQQKVVSDNYRAPLFGWNRDQMGKATTLMYRVGLPLFFAFLGGITGYQFAGAGQ